jgi:hypothetical protein
MMGYFHMINKKADTREKVLSLIVRMKEEILEGKVVGSYVMNRGNMSILYTHAGIRPKFFEYLKSREIESAEAISSFINKSLRDHVQDCDGLNPCQFEDELYDSGPDRGGTAIGGPL